MSYIAPLNECWPPGWQEINLKTYSVFWNKVSNNTKYTQFAVNGLKHAQSTMHSFKDMK